MAVITISRQFGSGGREVATRVCELLGYRYFDKELIAQVAAEIGLLENEAVDFSEEHYQGQSLLEGLFRPGPYVVARIPAWTHDPTGAETSFIKRLDKLEFVNLIRGVILGAYDRGNVVIVGRGGQAILADKPGALHVRIEAPPEIRINRIQQQQSCSAAQAQALIVERDRAVTKYLGEIFKVRPDDPNLYHLVINLGKWSLDAAAQIIANAVSQLPVEPVGLNFSTQPRTG
jgi:cytidylate kinase